MLKTAQKLFTIIAFAALVANAAGLSLVRPVSAASLQGAKDTLSNPIAGASATHTFQFSVPTSATLNEVRFQFSTTATNNTIPGGLVLTSATLGTLTNMDAGWTLSTSGGGSGLLEVQHTNSGENLGSDVVTIPLAGITNSSISACDGESSSDTCFVQIQTSTGTGAWDSNVIDETAITYTVIQAVTVSATVDPSMTFVISAVGASTVTGGVTTSVASTITTLPFGNLTAGTPKYVAHGLNVTTNSNSGYTVTMRVLTQMTGTYTANNIDPFAATNATWSNPIPWTEPTGSTPNTDTGWIGANTSDDDVAGFDDGEFGPVNFTANTVMSNTTSDNGSTRVYVTYALESNVYQPADVYTGTVVYTATTTY